MVEAKTAFRGLRGVAAAAGAVLALAGCAGTNVGGEWQCPMAQGKACVSIAGADPAIMKPADGTVTIRKPLHEGRVAAVPGAARSTATTGAAKDGMDCPGTCNPFSWLARLFGAEEAAAEDALSDAAPDAVPDAVPDESVPEAERDIEAAPVSAAPAAVPAPWRTTICGLATIFGPERSSGASGLRPSPMPRASTARPAGRGW